MNSEISAKPVNLNNVTINGNYGMNNYSNNAGFKTIQAIPVETVSLENVTLIPSKYEDIKNELKKYALNDSQINTSNVFNNYSDFQNIAFSNFSFLELFYSGNTDSLAGKTINELFLESCRSDLNNYTVEDYKSFIMDDDCLLDLWNEEGKKKYKSLFLGKLIAYGFGDLKIEEVVSGKDDFDAVVLVDGEGNHMIHYSCTDLYEFGDLIHDAKPILDELGLNSNPAILNAALSSLNPHQTYESQKDQALELFNKYLNDDKVTSVNVSGFSLGGALAEYVYFSSYGKSSKVDELTLFNPASYQVDIDKKLFDEAFNEGKIKRYASEGDMVSTLYGGEDYKEYTKPVYINYQDVIENVDKDRIVNKWVYNVIKKYTSVGIKWDFKGLLDKINNWCNENKDVISLLSIKTGQNLDVDFLGSLDDFPTLLTGIHMPYSVENNKKISFDKDGNVLKEVDDYTVTYPGFKEMGMKLFGYDITTEVKQNIYVHKTASEEELVEYHFGQSNLNYKDVEKQVFQNYLIRQAITLSSNIKEDTNKLLNNLSYKITGYSLEDVNNELKKIVFKIFSH